MKQISVLLGILVIILVVILSSAGSQQSLTYMNQSIFQGQSVLVQSMDAGEVNNEPAAVIHTGMVFSNSFKIRDVVLLNDMNTIVADHSTGGSLGTPSYIFTNISSTTQQLETDLDFEDWQLVFNTTYTQLDGTVMYVYKYDNISIAISQKDYSIIEDGGRFLLLQQAGGNLAASEIEPPFAIGMTEIISLSLILVVIGIVAYWNSKRKKDWRRV